ncbi:hypothetical protein [Embleya sp. NPDC001921]
MQGPSRDPVPGRRGTAGHWFGLVGLAAVAFLSIGLLAWIPPLVAGVRTRRHWDWVVLAVTSVSVVLAFVFLVMGSESSDEQAAREALGAPEPQTILDDVGTVMLLVLMVAVPVWWCVGSARWARATRAYGPAGYAPWPQAPVGPHPMAYPPAPPQAPPGYLVPGPQVGPGAPRGPVAPPPAAGPVPVDDPAARARARLQGLSERLREQDGGNPGGPR